MFEFDSRIRYSECAQDGKLSLAGLVNYFQDCAVFHSSDVGRGPVTWKAEHYAWMLASWQIVVNRYPKMNEIVRTRTQAYNFHGFEADRNFLMWDKKGELLAFANSRWIYFDTEAGRPIRVPKIEVESYGVDPEFEMEKAPRHIKMPAEGVAEKRPFKVRATNLDTNGHVNNEQYISDREIRSATSRPHLAFHARCRAGAKVPSFRASTNQAPWLVAYASSQRRIYVFR